MRRPSKVFSKVFIASLLLTGAAVVLPAQPASAATINNNTATKVVTMSGTNYTLVFDYNTKARITSLRIGTKETLDPAQGIYSAVKVAGTWTTTQSLPASPTVSVSGNVVTAAFATAVGSETWTFTVNDADVRFRLARTYGGAGTLIEQGTPMMNFAEHAFQNVRWPDDGGNFPVGGLANGRQTGWLATGSTLNRGIRAAKEQVSVVLSNHTDRSALRITGSTNRDALARGRATELWRATNNDLRLAVVTAAGNLQYATGSSLGYSSGSGDGHVRTDAGPIYRPVAVAAFQTDETTLTFAPANYDDLYDLGTLNGIDEAAISRALNDYARWMMQDTKRGASTEASILKAEVPALEMHWLAQLLQLIGEPAAINAFQAGLTDIKDHLRDPSGKIRCCRPGTGVYWGENYGDQAPGFALGVAMAYALDGDTAWLNTMKDAVRGGLDYQLANYTNSLTRLVRNSVTTRADTSFQNNYWESSSGGADGYSSAMLYDALTRWATLETNVLGDPARGTNYANIAATLKTSFNRNLADGGLWSPTTNTFYYGSGDRDVRYLPVQGAVLKTDIASRDRRQAIANSVEAQHLQHNADFHYMNIDNLFVPGLAWGSKIGENGGWYGAVDGDFYAGLPYTNDRNKIPTYIGNFANRYWHDGFHQGSAWARTNNGYYGGNVGFELWFPSHVMPVWGLYHYGYGFQPEYNQLVLAPFISQGMVGSTVKYRWRGQPVTVTYNSQVKFTVAAPNLQTNIKIRWINQTPGAVVHNRVDGASDFAMTVNSEGVAEGQMSVADAGTHTFECYDCAVANPPGGGHAAVTSWAAGSAPLRNDANTQAGMRITVGASPIVVTQLGRAFHTGNSGVHTLKLVDTAGRVLAATSLNMSQGTPDTAGFKYAPLTTKVTLAANTSYFIYSTERAGGDVFRDYQTNVTAGPGYTVNSAAYAGQATIGAAGNSYGPVTFRRE